MENGKNIPMLHFTWSGEVKQENIYVEFNGERVGPIESASAVEIDCPIKSDEIEININTGKKTLFKSKFKVEANKDYWCEVSGRTKDWLGLMVRMSDNQLKIDSAPVCYGDTRVGIMAFLFPIFGFVKACSKYNKKAGLIGAISGVLLSIILTAVSDAGRISLGVRGWEFLEYDPFSFTDIAIDILLGGLLSLKQIFVTVLEAIFGVIFS